MDGYLEFTLSEEGLFENREIQVFVFEDVQCPICASGNSIQHCQRNQDLTNEVIKPGGTEKQLILFRICHIGDFFFISLYPLI